MKPTLTAALAISIGLSSLVPACGSAEDPPGDPCSSSRTTMLMIIPAQEIQGEPESINAGICLDRAPDVAADSGDAACFMIEARDTMGACDCDPEAGRVAVASEHEPAIDDLKTADPGQMEGWDCVCEIPQLPSGEPREACQTQAESSPEVGSEPVRGWCYVDAVATPPIGDPQLTAMCAQHRVVRIVGQRAEPTSRRLLLVCGTNACEAAEPG